MQGLDLDGGVLGQHVQGFHAARLNAVETPGARMVPTTEHLVDLTDVLELSQPRLEVAHPGFEGLHVGFGHGWIPLTELRSETTVGDEVLSRLACATKEAAD